MAAMLGHLIAPTVAGALMPVVGSWVLMILGFLLMIAAAASTGLLPETLRTGDKTTEGREGDESPKADKIWKGGFNQVLSALKDSAGVLQSRSLILLVVTTLLALPASLCTLNLLSLYTSARFHIRLAETGYIQTAFGIAQAIVALVLLPWLSRVTMRTSGHDYAHNDSGPDNGANTSPTSENTNSARWAPSLQLFGTEVRRDLSLTRLSLAALTLGATVLGLAPSLPYFTAGLAVMALGSAAEGLIMGLMSTYVTADHRARLYTLIGILQVVSACYSDPMLAACYAAGLQLGGVWRGLPYLCVAVFCAVQGVLVGFVRVPRRE